MARNEISLQIQPLIFSLRRRLITCWANHSTTSLLLSGNVERLEIQISVSFREVAFVKSTPSHFLLSGSVDVLLSSKAVASEDLSDGDDSSSRPSASERPSPTFSCDGPCHPFTQRLWLIRGHLPAFSQRYRIANNNAQWAIPEEENRSSTSAVPERSVSTGRRRMSSSQKLQEDALAQSTPSLSSCTDISEDFGACERQPCRSDNLSAADLNRSLDPRHDVWHCLSSSRRSCLLVKRASRCGVLCSNMSALFDSFGSTVLFVVVGLMMCVPSTNAVDSCNSLTSLDITVLTSCQFSPLILKKQNGEFPTVDLSQYKQSEIEQVLNIVKEVGNTENLSITKTVYGNILVKGSAITSIAIHFGYDPSLNQTLILENNLSLTNITITPLVFQNNEGYRVKLRVKGNKLLPSDVILQLRNATSIDENSVIQDAGECIFDAPLKNLDQLDHCVYVDGDLKIDKGTDHSSKIGNDVLKKITGCMEVDGSDFSHLDFLSNIQNIGCKPIEIKNNKNLCLHPQQLKELKARLTVEYKDNKECKGECTNTYFMKEKDITCAIINGTITISGVSDETDLSHFAAVQEINGQLIIVDTTLSSIDMFPNLRTVDFSTAGSDKYQPAIFVKRNMKLSFFSFPNLTEVKLVDGALAAGITFEHNNETFYMEDEDLWKYGNITTAKLPTKPPPPRINYVENNQTQIFTRTKNNGTASEEEEINWKAVYIPLSVFGGIVVILAVGGLIFFLCRRKKKRKELKKKQNIIQQLRGRVVVTKQFSTGSSCGKRDPAVNGGNSTRSDSKSMGVPLPCDSVDVHINELLEMFESKRKNKIGAYNTDCTQIMRNRKPLKIKRDLVLESQKLEANNADKLEEKMCADVSRIYTHNMRLELFTINTRAESKCAIYTAAKEGKENEAGKEKEAGEEVTYDMEAPFDPYAFINAVMQSSCIHLSAKLISSALDWAADHRFGAYSDTDQTEGQLITVDGPVNIVGDTHGALMDLQAFLSMEVPSTPCKVGEQHIHPMFRYKYLFLGDYLDRGIYDLTCFTFLVVLAKIRKNKIFLLRGNHDWGFGKIGQNYITHMGHLYGEEEANRKKDVVNIRERLERIRNKLPICAVVDGKIFTCHGGISDYLVEKGKEFEGQPDGLRKLINKITYPLPSDVDVMNEVIEKKKKICKQNGNMMLKSYFYKNVAKFEEVNRLVVALTWSDPSAFEYFINSRHCGGQFSEKTLDAFFKAWNLQLLVRAHENIGFSWEHNGKVISVFGIFYTEVSEIGFPYFFNHPDYIYRRNHLEDQSSVGMLRLESNGTLTMFMMRYESFVSNEKVDENKAQMKWPVIKPGVIEEKEEPWDQSDLMLEDDPEDPKPNDDKPPKPTDDKQQSKNNAPDEPNQVFEEGNQMFEEGNQMFNERNQMVEEANQVLDEANQILDPENLEPDHAKSQNQQPKVASKDGDAKKSDVKKEDEVKKKAAAPDKKEEAKAKPAATSKEAPKPKADEQDKKEELKTKAAPPSKETPKSKAEAPEKKEEPKGKTAAASKEKPKSKTEVPEAKDTPKTKPAPPSKETPKTKAPEAKEAPKDKPAPPSKETPKSKAEAPKSKVEDPKSKPKSKSGPRTKPSSMPSKAQPSPRSKPSAAPTKSVAPPPSKAAPSPRSKPSAAPTKSVAPPPSKAAPSPRAKKSAVPSKTGAPQPAKDSSLRKGETKKGSQKKAK